MQFEQKLKAQKHKKHIQKHIKYSKIFLGLDRKSVV